MTIRERILARADLADALAARDLDALAAGLNAQPEVAAQPRFVTARTILAECTDGAAILDSLTLASQQIGAVKWALTFLSTDSGLDVGNPVTQVMLDQLASSGAIPAGHAGALKALAMQPVAVSRMDVESAMFNPDGSAK